MKVDLFAIPIFIDQVDLAKIELSNTEYNPTFLSKISTNYYSAAQLSPESSDYLSNLIAKHINTTGNYKNACIKSIWRNLYEATDTQEVHIHSNCQWSFIIYETVEISRTVFLNPAWRSIEAQIGDLSTCFSLSWKPEVSPGTIIIFPSFLEHYVLSGNEGSTIAGNVILEYVEKS